MTSHHLVTAEGHVIYYSFVYPAEDEPNCFNPLPGLGKGNIASDTLG